MSLMICFSCHGYTASALSRIVDDGAAAKCFLRAENDVWVKGCAWDDPDNYDREFLERWLGLGTGSSLEDRCAARAFAELVTARRQADYYAAIVEDFYRSLNHVGFAGSEYVDRPQFQLRSLLERNRNRFRSKISRVEEQGRLMSAKELRMWQAMRS